MQTPTLIFLLGSCITTAFGQTPLPDAQTESQRSAIEVKQKDLWDKTGYVHPFLRMPKFVIRDQKAIWTSPFHTAKSDIKWWAIFGAATGALIATDQYTAKHLPNDSTQTHLGADFSTIGAAYTLIPLGASFYFLGTAAGSGRFRETGLLSFETLIDSTIVESALKVSLQRARPLEGDGKGGFWDSHTKWYNAGFPSGHAFNAWAMASVFAHQYHGTKWVPLVAYGLATVVAGARVAGRKHFIGDTIAGGAMGWFIGDYVYRKRRNPNLDRKPVTQKVLDHVRIGATFR